MEGTENEPKNKPPAQAAPKAPPAPPPLPPTIEERDPLALAKERAKNKGKRKNTVEQPEDFMTQLKARQVQMSRKDEVVVENNPTTPEQPAAEAKPVIQEPKPAPKPLAFDENGIPVPPPLPPQNLSAQKPEAPPKAQTPEPREASPKPEVQKLDMNELAAAIATRREAANHGKVTKPTPRAKPAAHKKPPVPTPRTKAGTKPNKAQTADPAKPAPPAIAPKPSKEVLKAAESLRKSAAAAKPSKAKKAAEHFKKNPVERIRHREGF